MSPSYASQHLPKKRFGQHFLSDPYIIEAILQSLSLEASDTVLEIGPGLGALTKPLLQRLSQLEVVELDRDLIPKLQKICAFAEEKLRIHQADVLRFELERCQSQGPIRIVGNLPYNITTPLLFHLIAQKDRIRDMHFMVQKEVAERMVASPQQGAHYGRLSVMLQYHCQVQYLFDVPATAFSPPPKVESAVVKLLPHSHQPWVANDYTTFEELVRDAFNLRRKTLQNALRRFISKEQLQALQIQPNLRPENLSVSDFVKLSNAVANP